MVHCVFVTLLTFLNSCFQRCVHRCPSSSSSSSSLAAAAAAAFCWQSQVDRAPTGSGVTARMTVQYARGQIDIGQTRVFQSAVTGCQYTGSVVRSVQTDHTAITVQVSGTAYYTGTATFNAEDDDELKQGFLLKWPPRADRTVCYIAGLETVTDFRVVRPKQTYNRLYVIDVYASN